MTKRYASGSIKLRDVTSEPISPFKRTVESGTQAIQAGISGVQKTVQAGVEGVQKTAKTLQSSVQSVIEPAAQTLEAVGKVEDAISQPLSAVVNGITKLANGMLSFLGSEKVFEEDDFSGVAEFVTDTFIGAAGHAVQAIDANLHSMLGIADAENSAKQLIKLQEKGDLACDKSKGNLRMMVELPGIARQYNICLDSRTAKNVVKQISADPMVPLKNFGDCLLSEAVLKPIDHGIRDVKNAVADLIYFGSKPADFTVNLQNAFSNISKFIHKGLSGEYFALEPRDLADATTCFQIKTNNDPDMEYKVVDIPHFMESIVSTEFLSGKRMKPAPFARRPQRSRCSDHDMCRI